MMTFYAAVGRYRIRMEDGHKVPYIQKLGKLNPISIPEFVIWSTLLWEVLSYDELKRQYDSIIRESGIHPPELDELLEMLIRRKLIVRGLGYTGMDALYNMLADAFVMPYWVSEPRKAATTIRLWLKGKLNTKQLMAMAKGSKMSDDESRVINLVEQTPLSTAELIRCFDREIYDVSSPDKVIAGIYPDEDSEQARIANESRPSKNTNAVLQAVSNLYLNRQIVLETV